MLKKLGGLNKFGLYTMETYGLPALLFLFLIVFLPMFPVANQDVWKHLVDGKYLSQFHRFPHYSTFTFAPVKEYIESDTYDWLGSVVLYQFYNIGGYPLLHAFKLLIPVPFIFALTVLLGYRFDAYWFLSSWLILLALFTKMYARAAAFSVIFLGVLLLILVIIRQSKSLKYTYFLIPLIAVWGNFHGSSIVGVYMVICFFLGAVLDVSFNRKSSWNGVDLAKLCLITILVVLSSIYVKPYPNYEVVNRVDTGVEKFFLNDRTSDSSPETQTESQGIMGTVKEYTHGIIVEERPHVAPEFTFSLPKWNESPPMFFLLVILPLSFLAVVCLSFRTMSFTTLFMVGFLYWLGLGVIRALPLFGATTILLSILEMKQVNVPVFNVGIHSFFRRLSVWVLPIILFVISLFFYYSIVTLDQEYTLGKTKYYRPNLPEYVLERFTDTNVYTSADIGSYVSWLWWPRKKVFMQSKISAHRESFLENQSPPRRAWQTMMNHGIKVALLSKRIYNGGRNIFGIHPGWLRVVSSKPHGQMHLYCDCVSKQ